MHSIHRFRPSSPMVVAFIALFLAVSGTATAAKLITGKNIARSTITGKHVKDRSLSAADFRGTLAGAAGPAGPEGARGMTGAKGERGPEGDRGEQGLPGKDGAAAAKGDKGDTGDKGDPGQRGEKGDTGPQGEKGDTGPQGIPGAPGPKGDKGDPGPPGFNGVTRIDAVFTMDPHRFGSAGLTCPTSHPKVAGGGYRTTGAGSNAAHVYANFPTSNGWQVEAYNEGANHTLTVTAYAVCVAG